MPIKKPEDVTGISKLTPLQEGIEKTGRDGTEMTDNSGRTFASYMKEPLETNSLAKTSAVSPTPLATPVSTTPTLTSIQQQTQMAQSTLGDLQTQLNNPKLTLDQQTKRLLNKKLSSAQENFASASTKLGAPLVPEEPLPKGVNPLNRFISMVANGQNQLDAVQTQLSALSEKGEQLNPSEMLLVQIKLNKAQQQLEYSSILLSKAVDDFKQLMNTQL